MATLSALYESSSGKSEIRNKITAAGWNKAKAIVLDPAATVTQLQYARALLTGGPNEAIVHGALVLLQDAADPSDVQIQGAVDAVVDKFAELEA